MSNLRMDFQLLLQENVGKLENVELWSGHLGQKTTMSGEW